MRKRNRFQPLMFAALILGSVAFFFACGSDSGDSRSAMAAEQPTQAAASTEARGTDPAAKNKTAKPAGNWKDANWEDFRFSIPSNWKREAGMDIWYPDSERFDMGLPLTSLQCGVMPIMTGQTVEEQIKLLLHGTDPKQKKPVQKCGMNGFIMEAEQDLAHMTLTLEEQLGGGMVAVHFFNCRVPKAQYTQYETIFRAIFDSVHCK